MSVLHFWFEESRLYQYVGEAVCISFVCVVIFCKVFEGIALFEDNMVGNLLICKSLHPGDYLKEVVLSKFRSVLNSRSNWNEEDSTLLPFGCKGMVSYTGKASVEERFVGPARAIVNCLCVLCKA